MAMPPLLTYWHRQAAPLCLLLYLIAAILLMVSWRLREPVISAILSVSGLLTLLLALSFHHLTVADEGDVLAIRFGPFPLFRTAVRYDDIRRVEIGRTTVSEGWGIHLNLRGGWVWNLWGRDCVVLHLKRGSVLRLGTDDAENLARFIRSRIEDYREHPSA